MPNRLGRPTKFDKTGKKFDEEEIQKWAGRESWKDIRMNKTDETTKRLDSTINKDVTGKMDPSN